MLVVVRFEMLVSVFIITMAASIIAPMAIAMPPSDIRFAFTPDSA